MTEQNEAQGLVASLRAYLEELQETGVDGLPFAEAGPSSAAGPLNKSVPDSIASPASAPGMSVKTPSEAVAGKGETLDELRLELGACSRCKLGETRTNLVFGVGNPHTRLVFVGEAPGRDEDLQGEPFVGEAGQLLTKIIEAMQFKRNDVYICNVLKCRPPNNRNPQPEEIEQCQPFLLRQMKAIGPEVIVCLGTFAAQTLLETTEPISKMRGRFHDYHGIPLMPTFHPAYLLRNAGMKREVWSDMQQVMKLLGVEVHKK